MQDKSEATWDWEGVKGDKHLGMNRRLNAYKKARLKYRAFGKFTFVSMTRFLSTLLG